MYSTLGNEFFQQLANSFENDAFEGKYETLAHIFRRALNEKLEGKKISFPGAYPQLKYLITEYKIPFKAARLLHTTRIRLQRVGGDSSHLNERTLVLDLYAVALLLYYLYPGSVIPASLKALLPKEVNIEPLSPVLDSVLRVDVSHFDEQYIYGTDVVTDAPVRINIHEQALGTLGRLGEFTKYLHAGSQIHVIRPHGSIENLYPELLIYEPDYLINISSIAACFRPEGVSAYSYLVGKFQPHPISWQIELGNLAGELLDLHVHHKHFDIEEVILAHIRRHALVSISPAMDVEAVEREARRQSVYIEETINRTLVQNSPLYKREELLLEPSFFGQLLGIDGRMDLLQRDYNLLIEQKSGKASFYREEDAKPRGLLDAHYVQILLYQAVLHYAFRVPSNQMETYLLYSKYPEPLMSVGRAPELLYRAIELRNEIVWNEEQFRAQGFKVLTELTPSLFNTSGKQGTLWTQYTEPQLRDFLAPFHTQNNLALSYFLRFAQSVQQEQALAKIGSAQNMSFGFASKWLNTYEERRQKGSILCNLDLILVPDAEGKYRRLELRASTDNALTTSSNFRVGDIVVVYPCAPQAMPDVRKSIIFKGKRTELTDTSVVILLNHSQSSLLAFETPNKAYHWVIESDINESSYAAQYQGLYSFLRCNAERQDLLLLQRHPVVEPSVTLLGDYGEHQQLVLHAKQARDLFLILGPPGTGKTSYVLMNILREELLSPEANVLLSAFTNRAVNEICSKLVADGIDFIHLGTRLSAAPEYHPYLLEERVKNCRSVAEIREVLETTRVFCGNCTLLAAQLHLLAIKKFSLAIIDEASQLLEPQLLPLFCAHETEGRKSIGRFVLIGDHKQLPAIAQQSDELAVIEDEALRAIGLTNCKNSFFERFYLAYRNDASVTHFLTKQARMHEAIAAFANYNFYQGRLITRGLSHQTARLATLPETTNSHLQFLASRRLLFLSYAAKENNSTNNENVNRCEAELIARLVEDFIAYYTHRGVKFSTKDDLGIIVPYRMQIAAVRAAIRLREIKDADLIAIDTVERYQGSERKVIIYGFTAQTPFQLNFLASSSTWETGSLIDRKLNVAMTRAREHLLLVGNAALLSEDYTFYKLIRYCKTVGAFLEVESKAFVSDEWTYTAPPPRTAKKWHYPFDAQLFLAYERLILEELQRPNPERMGKALNSLGEDFIDNLLCYGRSRLEHDVELVMGESLVTQLTPSEQALLWADHYLPLYYEQSMQLYTPLHDVLLAQGLETTPILFIEVGNSIAGALGLFRQLYAVQKRISYCGIDVPQALATLGVQLFQETNTDVASVRFESDEECLASLLEQTPASVVVLHCSCTFTSWSAERAAKFARTLFEIFEKQRKHRYFLCGITEDGERERRSYRVFHEIVRFAKEVTFLQATKHD